MAQRTKAPRKPKEIQDMEMEVVEDLYNRLTTSCYKKCTAANYLENSRSDIHCMDKCMRKYFLVYGLIGKKLSDLTMKDDDKLEKIVFHEC
ncbi:hypothetical protein WA026_016895 [Henosepilachna vigintioctopunctata]|uniref:Mitochondrial import inner membrane translocase subunit n=1 Tax=Henosepilachna vigintioctopunctata TaxID=420089 RepID=A0AAW1U048_9CUCU